MDLTEKIHVRSPKEINKPGKIASASRLSNLSIMKKQKNIKRDWRNKDSDIVKKEKNVVGRKFPKAPYKPMKICGKEHANLLLLKDDKLVRKGDKFDTYSDFVQYLNDNAQQWLYYYKFYDRSKSNSATTFTYGCIYQKSKKYKTLHLKKSMYKSMTDCPCKIKIRRVVDEQEVTVVSVCNHHDHDLSQEEFLKLHHGKRLPPYLKEEILDLLTMNVDIKIIKKHVLNEINLDMAASFFYAEKKNRVKNKRTVSAERFKELYKKMKALTDSSDPSAEPPKLCLRKIHTPITIKRYSEPPAVTTRKRKQEFPSSSKCDESETKRTKRSLKSSNKVCKEPAKRITAKTRSVNNRYGIGDVVYTEQYINKRNKLNKNNKGRKRKNEVKKRTIDKNVLGDNRHKDVLINSIDDENIECIINEDYVCLIVSEENSDCVTKVETEDDKNSEYNKNDVYVAEYNENAKRVKEENEDSERLSENDEDSHYIIKDYDNVEYLSEYYENVEYLTDD